MKTTICIRSLWLSFLGTLIIPQTAGAQMVDYGSLQSLFGEPVTTSATGTPQRASEVAANMTIITADEIRQSGRRTIPEIVGLYVPGIDVLQSGIMAFDVGVRGYQQPYNPRLLVLLDGRQVFNDDYSRTPWDNLPVNIDDIRQIEVVKGASSALFGSNATGGVINIVTYSPIYDKNNVVSATFGTQQSATADATVTQHFGDNGIKMSIGGFAADEFKTERPPIEAAYNNNAPYQGYVSESSVSKITDNFLVNTEFTYAKKNDEQSIYTYTLNSFENTSYSARIGANWQTDYGIINSDNYINHNSSILPSDFTVYSETTLIMSQLSEQFKVGNDDTLRALLEYRNKRELLTVDPTFIKETPDITQQVMAASGTWLHQFSDSLSWTNAIRAEYNQTQMSGTLLPFNPYNDGDYTRSFDTLAINSGLAYKVDNLDTLRASFGRGIQDPSLIDNGFNADVPASITPPVAFLVVGNPDLKPTVVDNYELGYDRKIPEIDSTVRTSVYYEVNRNLIAPTQNNPPSQPVMSTYVNGVYYLETGATNVGESKGWGAEIELFGKNEGRWRWNTSYSFQTIRDAELVAQTLGYQNSAPESHFRALLGYTMGSWEIDGQGQYVTSTGMLREASLTAQALPVSTVGYATFSGRIGYQINDIFTVALTGITLQQAQQEISAYPDVQRQIFLGLTGKF